MRSKIRSSTIFLLTLFILSLNHAQAADQDPTSSSSKEQAAILKVEVVDAPEMDKESNAVLDQLKALLHGLEHGNLDAIAACLSDNVTTLDEQCKVTYGKTDVMENIKKKVIGTGNEHPIKRLVIYHPFVRIKGDSAMVSFRATKEMGGKNPVELESWCSEVFERKNGNWLVLQLKTNWKPVSTSH